MSLEAGGWPSLVCPSCGAPLSVDPRLGRCSGCGAEYPMEDGILRLVSTPSGSPAYDPHYFKTLPQVEERHFWFVARRKLILDVLRRHVPDLLTRPLFDIGCGSGGLLAFLAQQGVPISGACDAYIESLHIVRRRTKAPLVLVNEGRLPPLAAGLRLVSLFDVLEHLDDDAGVLAWLCSVLEPGGVVVLTVPAHPFLFDEMDEIAHHRRRYRRVELREKLEAAGLQVRYLSHFMAPLVPGLVLWRSLARIAGGRKDPMARREVEFRVAPVLNEVLKAVLHPERLWLRHGRLPFGSSLIAVAARPASGS